MRLYLPTCQFPPVLLRSGWSIILRIEQGQELSLSGWTGLRFSHFLWPHSDTHYIWWRGCVYSRRGEGVPIEGPLWLRSLRNCCCCGCCCWWDLWVPVLRYHEHTCWRSPHKYIWTLSGFYYHVADWAWCSEGGDTSIRITETTDKSMFQCASSTNKRNVSQLLRLEQISVGWIGTAVGVAHIVARSKRATLL